MWSGIINNKIVEPYFFDGTLTAEHYWAFLEFELIPELTRLFPEDINSNFVNTSIRFQQDRAPSHHNRGVREFRDIAFSHRWTGRRGSIQRPAKSPGLPPLSYCLWVIWKAKNM